MPVGLDALADDTLDDQRLPDLLAREQSDPMRLSGGLYGDGERLADG